MARGSQCNGIPSKVVECSMSKSPLAALHTPSGAGAARGLLDKFWLMKNFVEISDFPLTAARPYHKFRAIFRTCHRATACCAEIGKIHHGKCTKPETRRPESYSVNSFCRTQYSLDQVDSTISVSEGDRPKSSAAKMKHAASQATP